MTPPVPIAAPPTNTVVHLFSPPSTHPTDLAPGDMWSGPLRSPNSWQGFLRLATYPIAGRLWLLPFLTLILLTLLTYHQRDHIILTSLFTSFHLIRGTGVIFPLRHPTTTTTGQRLPAPSDNVRFDRTLNHFPVFTSQRLTCNFTAARTTYIERVGSVTSAKLHFVYLTSQTASGHITNRLLYLIVLLSIGYSVFSFLRHKLFKINSGKLVEYNRNYIQN